MPSLVVLQSLRRPHPKIARNCIPRSCDIASVVDPMSCPTSSNKVWPRVIEFHSCMAFSFVVTICDRKRSFHAKVSSCTRINWSLHPHASDMPEKTTARTHKRFASYRVAKTDFVLVFQGFFQDLGQGGGGGKMAICNLVGALHMHST